MKILLDTSSYFPIVGGVQLVVHHLAEALSKEGHLVTVSGFLSHDREKVVRNYKFENKTTFRGRKYVKHLKLYKDYQEYIIYKILKKVKPDIIHCHYVYPTAYDMFTVLEKYKLKIPVVVTAHGVDIQKVPELNYGLRLDPENEKKIKTVLNKSTKLVAISNNIFDNYVELGIDKNKIKPIANPVAYENFIQTAACSKEKVGLNTNLPLILSVGRSHPKKGHIRLLKILKNLENKDINVQTMVIGKNSKKLLPLIEKMEIKNPVYLIDRVPPAGLEYKKSVLPNIKQYFDAADIFAMTSTVEGFGLVTAEAMAAGIPVVGFNAAGTDSIIKDGKNGFLVDVDDEAFAEKIIELLENPEKYKKIKNSAIIDAQKYSSSEIAKQHIELYNEIING